MSIFETNYAREKARYEALISRPNKVAGRYNGIYD